jgi:ribosomal protein L11 methylase PrmA
VRHDEVDLALAAAPGAARVLRPEVVPFVSYPYEWSFSQLKDAALLTLRVQKAAMAAGMSLKDATAFNVQFHRGRPVLIDTLSFALLRDGEPWVAYRQFCESFLAPLALMSHRDARLHQLLRAFLDGIPLDLARTMLPWRTRLNPGLAVHLHLHASAQRKLAGRPAPSSARPLGRHAVAGLVDSLDRTVRSLTWTPAGTVWGDYYTDTNYSSVAFEHKRDLVAAAIDRLRPGLVWDLGANVGTFSRLASDRGIQTVAFDIDVAAVEKNYRTVVERRESTLLPLLVDLVNPSASLGWHNQERLSLAERGPADAVLALALVHHLAIGHNVPFAGIARFFASIARALVIEWVPKTDSQVQRLLATREDVFDAYTRDAFESAFSEWFSIESATPVRESERAIYVMRAQK